MFKFEVNEDDDETDVNADENHGEIKDSNNATVQCFSDGDETQFDGRYMPNKRKQNY